MCKVSDCREFFSALILNVVFKNRYRFERDIASGSLQVRLESRGQRGPETWISWDRRRRRKKIKKVREEKKEEEKGKEKKRNSNKVAAAQKDAFDSFSAKLKSISYPTLIP